MDLHERIELILSDVVAAEQSLVEFKQEYAARQFALEASAKEHETRLTELLETACKKLRRERDRLADLDPTFNQTDGKLLEHRVFFNDRPPKCTPERNPGRIFE